MTIHRLTKPIELKLSMRLWWLSRILYVGCFNSDV